MTDVRPSKQRTVTAKRIGPDRDGVDDFTYYVVTTSASTSQAQRKAHGQGKDQAKGERRVGGRVRTRLRDATVSETRGRVLAECRIHDRSHDGARLQLDRDCPLPKTFVLRDPSAGVSHRATLVWQNGLAVGVRLTT